jgi:hypothetical protein
MPILGTKADHQCVDQPPFLGLRRKRGCYAEVLDDPASIFFLHFSVF